MDEKLSKEQYLEVLKMLKSEISPANDSIKDMSDRINNIEKRIDWRQAVLSILGGGAAIIIAKVVDMMK